MKITIIHKEGCPLCETAIREFTGDGHDVESRLSLSEIEDKDTLPSVFAYDRFIPWQPKNSATD